jgi:thiazole/oxazole-forming peptide maturase SagD family component
MELALAVAPGGGDAFERELLRRMFCPLSGIAQDIGFAKRGPLEPRLAIAGGDLTGVHLLRGLPAPRAGAYHIGGSGTTYAEAVIRTLGETLERYAQFVALADGRHRTRIASLDALRAEGKRVLAPPDLRLYSDEQLARTGFPFSGIDAATPVGWLECRSVLDGSTVWAPAQLALVAYGREAAEPRHAVGVTTGSAAHRGVAPAARNALLELVQIDAAMGHWYGAREALAIPRCARTRAVERVIRSRLHPNGPEPRFFWLPSADLPGFAVACLFEGGSVPRLAAGLGADLRLDRAMYHAFLEAAAVAQLAKVILFRRAMEGNGEEIDPSAIYDLDTNVGYYALDAREAIQRRFGEAGAVAESDLPPDIEEGTARDLRHLVDAFRDTGKELVFLDLTTRDVRDLGFCVVRFWSPDLLSLSLPSAPPLLHPRFAAYGGVTHEAPHPYP